jgi:UDP-N-acetylmuramoyl-tripeptide--D-alanyl-D-alanine ligase
MKTFFRKCLEWLLFFRAQKIIANVEHIIGITGSVGKTSTRMAIAKVLSSKYKVQTSRHNFNTRMGILLSLFNIEEIGDSPKYWLRVLLRAYFAKIPAPEILVLEYGVDTPKNMDELLSTVVPDIAVITPITPAHMDSGQFSSIEQIREEKLKLARAAKKGIIANGFDKETARYIKTFNKSFISLFGEDQNSHIILNRVHSHKNMISFHLNQEHFSAPVFGTFQAQIFVPAILLAKRNGISKKQIQNAINTYLPPPGRGRIFPGVHESSIWDFSYNSSPSATRAVLESLLDIKHFSRKIILLGNMNELGKRSEKEHEIIGNISQKVSDLIFFVGKNSKAFLRGTGIKKNVTIFPDAQKAGNFLSTFLQPGDFLLVKGSQNGVFLEEALQYLLKRQDDKQYLCRQSKHWQRVRKHHFSQKNRIKTYIN